MPKLIKDGQIIEDNWRQLSNEDSVSGQAELLPLELWLAQDSIDANTGLWLSGDEDISALQEKCHQAPLIAIEFPAFMDGRGFSAAYLLRERFGYKGELRAIGHIIRDQLCYLARVGFSSFSLSSEDPEEAVASLSDLTEFYQASADTQPLFRRR